ncbi:dTDP-4-dehydrorhamnose reductase [Pseudomonas sp. C27(2019)]|uniref:dTDP-4-dehydrorhamnose reductase n=1 Tax=Pseudomonas sp. C27(2019) TaxID=2604941 RepID=UPI0012449DF3|nr:dTDP-4-dehydrorhamnose reductase [Pseudomonas sp. C27(2019)]QEY59400.1 dTDP-4-dehydrorhamnose reductase [Pseudomonas sp. C27(2019)]
MFKVLVTGAKGQVGSELVKAAPAGFTVIGLGSNELDITNQQQVTAVMAQYKPDLIINAAAYTAVDKAESDIETAFAVNEKAVALLAQAAYDADIPLFHISTDYVFDGQASTPYKETDTVNPQSVYGASKLAGEQALERTHAKHIILRTSWVFGATGNNFVKTMLRLGKEREELSVVADQYGCPTSARSIAEVLWQLAEKYVAERTLPWGVYHFSNSPACTWYEFACEIFEQAVKAGVLERKPVVHPITTAEYPTPAKRPAWSVLDCGKIERAQSIALVQWSEEIIDIF